MHHFKLRRHTYLHTAFFFFPVYLKSDVEYLKKKMLNMEEKQDKILQSFKSLERSLPWLVLGKQIKNCLFNPQ